MASKRVLRKERTCNNAANPLHDKLVANQIEHLVPSQIRSAIQSSQTISCNQITNLPTLRFPTNMAQALQAIKFAAQWQTTSLATTKEQVHKGQRQREQMVFDELDQMPSEYKIPSNAEQVRPQSQNSLLLQNELNNFTITQNFPNYQLQQYDRLPFQHPSFFKSDHFEP